MLSAATRGEELSFFGVPPLHSSVLEPDLHLRVEEETQKQLNSVTRGAGKAFSPISRKGHGGLTCESLRPSLAASFFLSGLLMYFCFWNIFSSALRCTSEKTARRSMPRRGLPRAASGQEKVPGMGTTAEAAAGQENRLSGDHGRQPSARRSGARREFYAQMAIAFQRAITGIKAISSNVGNGSMVACFVEGFKGLRPQKARRGTPAGVEVWEKSFPSQLWVFFQKLLSFQAFS